MATLMLVKELTIIPIWEPAACKPKVINQKQSTDPRHTDSFIKYHYVKELFYTKKIVFLSYDDEYTECNICYFSHL